MGLGARERIIVNFFSAAEPSIYKGWGALIENKCNFFCILFGSKKNNALYLLQ